MSNNDRLIQIQKTHGFKAGDIAAICHTKRETVYSWRKVAGGRYRRNMPDGAMALLEQYIASNGV